MLGNVQREQLKKCAGWASSDNVVLHVVIGRWMQYTREAGTGFPISVVMYYVDVDPPERDLSSSIARCQHDHTAIEKAQEIARHLVSLGVSREQIFIKK